MNKLNPTELAAGMTEEILDVIYKYEESMLLPTVLGVLDVIKFELIQGHMRDLEDEED